MVKFELTMGGFDVMVNGQLFGHLMRGHGFFIDPTTVKTFLEVPEKDLEIIALKAQEVRKYGSALPICPSCKGTPNFPGKICNPNTGAEECCAELHRAMMFERFRRDR